MMTTDKISYSVLYPNNMIKSFPKNLIPAAREDATYSKHIEIEKSIQRKLSDFIKYL